MPPLTTIERRALDYIAHEEVMVHLDAVVRRTRHVLACSGPNMARAWDSRPVDPQAAILGEEDQGASGRTKGLSYDKRIIRLVASER
jgi:hypothetical protein